jgi:hypothetical protein
VKNLTKKMSFSISKSNPSIVLNPRCHDENIFFLLSLIAHSDKK